jgi:hypothetical protein
MKIKTAVLATSRLVDLAGSEIATLEIADELRSLGVMVSIATYELGGPFIEVIHAAGYGVIDLAADQTLGHSFDLAWVHHAPTFYALFLKHNIQARHTVFASLSYFEPLECPPFPLAPVSRYLVNSYENLEHFREHYPEFASTVEVFPNAAPEIFWQSYTEIYNDHLTTIAIVSNHPPPEVTAAATLLRNDGIKVDFYGVTGIKERIKPEILSRYDAVISIGKTVQYCLASGIPIYCYDHFAGPGWITPKNFEIAKNKNFSGRCTPSKRLPADVVQEVIQGYSDAVKHRASLRESASNHFNLSKNVKGLLSAMADMPNNVGQASTTQKNIALRHSAAIVRYFALQAQCSAINENANNQMTYRDQLVRDLEMQLRAVDENANNQIAYRDQLIADLEIKLRVASEKLNQLELKIWSKKNVARFVFRLLKVKK